MCLSLFFKALSYNVLSVCVWEGFCVGLPRVQPWWCGAEGWGRRCPLLLPAAGILPGGLRDLRHGLVTTLCGIH